MRLINDNGMFIIEDDDLYDRTIYAHLNIPFSIYKNKPGIYDAICRTVINFEKCDEYKYQKAIDILKESGKNWWRIEDKAYDTQGNLLPENMSLCSVLIKQKDVSIFWDIYNSLWKEEKMI